MKLTILTPTGQATLYNTHTKKGYKALWQYIKYTQKENKPFLVLPGNTIAHDLIDVVDNSLYLTANSY